jgi:CRP-like cAMP-binding protein
VCCVPLTGTLTAIEDCELLVLSQDSFLKMQRDDPYLALVFARICMVRLAVYLSL